MMTTEELFERFAREPQIVRRVPVSTYRLQLDRTFTFADARDTAAYLDALGVSDFYLSPFFQRQTAIWGMYTSLAQTLLKLTIPSVKEDDRAKLFLTHRALQFRRAQPALFLEGEYEPLETRGPLGADACAGFPVALLTRED